MGLNAGVVGGVSWEKCIGERRVREGCLKISRYFDTF